MRRHRLRFLVVALACGGPALVACVDGATPNCKDPNVQCGPSADGSFPADASDAAPADGIAPRPDAPSDSPSGTTDGSQDSAVDAGSDAARDADAAG